MSLISSIARLQHCDPQLYKNLSEIIDSLENGYDVEVDNIHKRMEKLQLVKEEEQCITEKIKEFDAEFIMMVKQYNTLSNADKEYLAINKSRLEATRNYYRSCEEECSKKIETILESIAHKKSLAAEQSARWNHLTGLIYWSNELCSDQEYVVRAKMVECLYTAHINLYNKLNFSADKAISKAGRPAILSSLPNEIWQMSKLQKLGITDRCIQNLPPQVRDLTQLTELDISNNPIKALPAEIAQLSQLKKLNASQCELETLPSELSQLTQLIFLNVRKNSLKAIPESLACLPAKCEFIASENRLAPDAVKAFKKQIEQQKASNPMHGPKFVSEKQIT